MEQWNKNFKNAYVHSMQALPLAAVYSTGFTILATLIMGFIFIPKVRNDFARLKASIILQMSHHVFRD